MYPRRTISRRIEASAPPRNRTPCGKVDGGFAGALEASQVQHERQVAVLLGRYAESNLWNSSLLGSKPVLHVLNENGGLATTKTKVFSRPSADLKCGLASTLSSFFKAG